jgi:uncharacterized membrane protein YkvA (DUF1232 family)
VHDTERTFDVKAPPTTPHLGPATLPDRLGGPGRPWNEPTDRTRELNGSMARSESKERRGRRPVRGSAVIGRAIGVMAFLPLASRAPLYARLIMALVADERMPAARKALLAGAAGYLLVGRDLVPDELPILGGLDDLIVVVIAVDLFMDGVPDELLAEKLVELGIDRPAFDDDMARIRRMTPAPIRKTIRRIPQMIAQAGEAFEHSGIGPRVRAWISKEDSIA